MRENLWSIVKNEIPNAPLMEIWDKKDGKAQAIISLSIEDSQIVHIYI